MPPSQLVLTTYFEGHCMTVIFLPIIKTVFAELSFHGQVRGHAAECKAQDQLSRTRVKGKENKEEICLYKEP